MAHRTKEKPGPLRAVGAHYSGSLPSKIGDWSFCLLFTVECLISVGMRKHETGLPKKIATEWISWNLVLEDTALYSDCAQYLKPKELSFSWVILFSN
jgi:hypothetical protein